MSRTLAALLAAAVVAPASAQEAPGAEGPTSGPALGDGPAPAARLVAKRAAGPAKRAVLAPLDVAPLLAHDAIAAAGDAEPRVGVIRRFKPLRAPTRLTPGARGVDSEPDGALVWTAEVSAPGALGVRLHVERCELPPGATFAVFDADDPSEAYGPFAGRAGDFLLPTVFGETVRVELRVPADEAGERIRFSLDRAAHRYRERGEGMEDSRVGPAAKATSCNNNVACDASYTADVARAVATLEITKASGVFLCTGALVNDSVSSSSVPYFLTAHHCIALESEARNTEFFFDYRASTCDGSPPPLSSVPRVNGATLLETSVSSDFTLLRLTGTLPSNRYFCGWTAARQASGTDVVGVHHPGGSHMRISYGRLLDPDGNFHQVRWTSGVTAGGSSGSPLFNTGKQLIGQLYGGASSCSFQNGIDEYGRFDRTYPSIASYLGTGQDASLTDAFDPGDDTRQGATLLVPSTLGRSHGPHSLSSIDPRDWFAFDLGAGRRYRFFSTGTDDVRATLWTDDDGDGDLAQAAFDDDSGGSLQFSVDFTAPSGARVWLSIEPHPGSVAAEYELHYVEVDARRTRRPPHVARLKKSVGIGTVTLRWKDRARTETGYYVELSDDHGESWSRVAELPADAHEYLHEPGPGSHVYRVGPWNASPLVDWKSVTVSVRDANQTDSFDPLDDSGAGAVLLSPSSGGITSERVLSRADNEDWFRIALVAGRTYEFRSSGSSDTFAELFDDPGGFSEEASDDDAGAGANFRITYKAPRSGTYWLRVTAYEEGELADYTLAWTEK